MDDLRLVLIIVSALAIAGIFLHGHFSLKKSAKPEQEKEPEPTRKDPEPKRKDPVYDDGGFDQFGVSKPRVKDDVEPTQHVPLVDAGNFDIKDKFSQSDVNEHRPTVNEDVASFDACGEMPMEQQPIVSEETVESASVKPIEENAVVETVELEAEQSPIQTKQQTEEEPQESSLMDGVKDSLESIILPKRAPRKRRPRKDPKLSDNQIDMFGAEDQVEEVAVAEESPKQAAQVAEPEEVIALNVMAAEGMEIRGAELLPALLTLGLKFGDFAIFHRHQDNAGNGPVLFSLANMFKPGVFDLDNMENFSTRGVSLFMSLPLEQGEPQQTFSMMHNAARKLAEEFGAQVLDGSRSVLTKQKVQHYTEQIREFERRQLLRR